MIRSNDDYEELIWEDGRVRMRGLSRKSSVQKTPSFLGYSYQSSKAQEQRGEDTSAPKRVRFEAAPDHINKYPLLRQSVLDRRKLGGDNNEKMMESSPSYYPKSAAAFFYEHKRSKNVNDPQTVPVNEYGNLEAAEPFTHTNCLPTVPDTDNIQIIPQALDPRLDSSRSQKQYSITGKASERRNFSMFLTPQVLGKPNCSWRHLSSGVQEMQRNCSKSVKNVELNQPNYSNRAQLERTEMMVPGDEQSAAVETHRTQIHDSLRINRNKRKHSDETIGEVPVASNSVCSRGASNDSTYILKRSYHQINDEAGYLSENEKEEGEDTMKPVLARRPKPAPKKSGTAQVHNLSERKRRDKFNKKMRALQELIPNCNKVDKAAMLDEAIEYMKTLQLQLQMMWMGSGYNYMSPMMLPAVNGSLMMSHWEMMRMQMAAAAPAITSPIPGVFPAAYMQSLVLPGTLSAPAAALQLSSSAHLSGASRDSMPNTNPYSINYKAAHS